MFTRLCHSRALLRGSESACCGQVFLPRHGRGHVLNPSEVNYRANVFGMKKLGVSWIISVTAVGRCALPPRICFLVKAQH